MSRPALRVVPTADDVAAAAAEAIAARLAEAIRDRGLAHWCTTGGSSAPGIYRALRAAPLRDRLDWSRVHTWWGDDRFVVPGDPLSNVTPFDTVLREPGVGLSIRDAAVHPVPVAATLAAGGGPAEAAAAYERELDARGPRRGASGVPAFDLIVLGVGPDGHVLSVFPGSDVFDSAAWVEPVPAPTHVEPHLPRVTLHPRLLAAAHAVLVATSGPAKAGVLARALAGGNPREVPLRLTLTPNATWVVDAAAGADLR